MRTNYDTVKNSTRILTLGVLSREGKMKIIKMNEVPKEPYINPLFTGTNVTKQFLVSDSKDLQLSLINFGKGVRNKFHIHDSDQILIVTAGKGIVATEKEKKIVGVGEVIFIPGGEKHMHGATEESDFSHLVFLKAGVKYTQADQE
jgi:quercetin dioxygenase-like cupin family protein